jgi:hypothetical protein
VTSPDEEVQAQIQPEPPPASAVKAEHVDFVAEHSDLTTEEAEEKTKAELIEHEQAIVADDGEASPEGEQPAFMAQHQPVAAAEPVPLQSAGNESPVLPASLHGAAVRAHGILNAVQDHLAAHGETDLTTVEALVALARDELEKFLPDSLLAHSHAEGARLVRERGHSLPEPE